MEKNKMLNKKPKMDDNEIEMIIKYLDKNDIMFEYGSGYSTLLFSKYVKKYISIEHNKEWFKKINSQIEKNTHLWYIPDINGNFDNYVNVISTFNLHYDKVLIDGRDRVNCAKAIIPYLKESSIVFLHDYYSNQYNDILKWFKIIDLTKERPKNLRFRRGLAVLKKKDNNE